MNQTKTDFMRAVLHVVTGAGLFRRLEYPGATNEFIDSRSLEEILASSEIDRVREIYEADSLAAFD